MKTKIFSIKITLFLIGLMSISSLGYSKEYLITGRIKDLPANIQLYLITVNDKGTADTLQSVTTKDDEFIFRVQDPTVGKIHFIIVSNKGGDATKNWIRFIIDGPVTNISADINQLSLAKVAGSDATKIYENFFEIDNRYRLEINALLQEVPELRISRSFIEILNDTALISLNLRKVAASWKQYVKTYIKANDNSSVTPLLIMKHDAFSLEEKTGIYNDLPVESKHSYYGKQFEKYLAVERLTRTVQMGKEIPNFNLITPEGKNVSIKMLIGQSKFTLVDFWASWCSPCRAAIPHLKEVYNQFKDRGFNIVGVVTAKIDKESNWKKAITADRTPWAQGRDTTNITDIYFPRAGIPSYILVDQAGKLIATSLVSFDGKGRQGPGIKGEELAKTLEQLLKVK